MADSEEQKFKNLSNRVGRQIAEALRKEKNSLTEEQKKALKAQAEMFKAQQQREKYIQEQNRIREQELQRDWENRAREEPRIKTGSTAGVLASRLMSPAAGAHPKVDLILFLALFIHLWDFFALQFTFHTMRFSMYFIFAVIVLMIYRLAWDETNHNRLMLPFIVSFFAWIFPIFLDKIGLFDVTTFGTILLWVPIWGVYLIFFTHYEKGFFAKLVIAFYIIIIFLFIGANVGQAAEIVGASEIYTQAAEPITVLQASGIAIVQNFKATTSNLYDLFVGNIKKQIQYAAGGDFYTGRVDQQAKERLGVFIEEVSPGQPDFYTDEPISVYATLKAKNLDRDKPINIVLSCQANPDTTTINANRITPSTIPGIQFEYEEDIDCTFDRNTLSSGAHPIKVEAAFDFSTNAYTKSYFMYQSRARTLRREGIDPLDQFGITDKQPIAIFTNGPLNIGMDLRNPPMELDATAPEFIKTLRITLRNQWEGEIIKIRNLQIIIPDSMEIQDNKCSGYDFIASDPIPNDGEITYTMKDPASNYGRIPTYKTIGCPIVIKQDDYPLVLGASPIATHYFKTNVDYDYKLSRQTTVIVKKTEGQQISAPQTTPSIPSGLDKIELKSEHYLDKTYTIKNTDKLIKSNSADFQAIAGDNTIHVMTSGQGLTNERDYSSTLYTLAEQNNLDYLMLKALVKQESQWGTQLQSSAGALGYTHVIPTTAAGIGCSGEWQTDAYDGFVCGIKYLNEMRVEVNRQPLCNDREMVCLLAAYNGGPDAIQNSENCANQVKFECKINQGLLSQTENYINIITATRANAIATLLEKQTEEYVESLEPLETDVEAGSTDTLILDD